MMLRGKGIKIVPNKENSVQTGMKIYIVENYDRVKEEENKQETFT